MNTANLALPPLAPHIGHDDNRSARPCADLSPESPATLSMRHGRKLAAPILVSMLVGLLATGCAQQPTPAEAMPTVSPNVSYKYSNDKELINANQNAAAYCSRHQAIPNTKSLSVDSDGNKIASFVCLHVSPMPVISHHYNPNLGYNYLSEQELADAAASAQTYCMNNGLQKLVTTVDTTSSGGKAVSFQCAPR